MNTGKLVTLGILALATALGTFAWNYHRGRSDKAIGYWGAENAVLLRGASQVALARLKRLPELSADDAAAPEHASEVITIGDSRWRVMDEVDLTQSRGLVHLRQALVQNSSFGWTGQPSDETDPAWDYLLRFRNTEPTPAGETPPGALDVAVGIEGKCLQALDGRPAIRLRIAAGVETFIQDQAARQ